MTNSFEDASKATEEMFLNDNEQSGFDDNTDMGDGGGEINQEAQENENMPAQPTQQQAGTESDESAALLERSVQTADAAAQAAAEQNARLEQAMSQIEALQSQNRQLMGTVEELSKKNEEKIIEDILEPPTLDISSLAFEDEDTVRQAQAKYAQDMAEYNRKQIMKELSPFLEQAKDGMREKEKKEALQGLREVPELKDIETMMPQIEKIIRNNKALSSDDIPIDEKLITAYAIARGVNSINTPPVEKREPSAEELMQYYNQNADFRAMIDKQRLKDIKQNQDIPIHSASSGAVSAALDIKEKPKTLEEASRRAREIFGL